MMSATSDDARAGEGLRLLGEETARLHALLDDLGPSDWDRPTNCDPWTVRQLVAHTVRGAESFLANLANGLRGVFEPAFPPEQRVVRMNEIAAREPDAIVADVRAIDERFGRELAALRPDRLWTRANHPYGLMTARWFVDQRLAEVAVHRWDLEHSLGHPATLDQDVATHLLPMLFEENLPARLAQHTPPIAGRIRFVVSGAPGPSWTIQVVAADGGDDGGAGDGGAGDGGAGDGGAAALGAGDDGTADLTVDGDPVSLVLLVYGRRALTELEGDGLLAISGDRVLAERFAELLPGP